MASKQADPKAENKPCGFSGPNKLRPALPSAPAFGLHNML